MTPQNAILIQTQCQLALNNASGTTDEDKKYEYIREGYEAVRTLQEAEEETDYAESPRASMEEYLTESLSNIEKVLGAMETAATGMEVIPDPLPDGLVLISTGGSGSASA